MTFTLSNAVFQRLSAAVWVIDLSTLQFVGASDEALRLWRAPSLQALNDRLAAASSADMRDRLRRYGSRLGAGGPSREQWVFYPDGVATRCEVALSALPDGDGLFLLGEVVPEQRGEADQGALVAAISHDLRTPMHSVLGFLELLGDAGLDPPRQELAETARGAAEGMIALLDDLLDAAKLASGRLELEHIAVDIWDVSRRCCKLISLSAHRKGLRVNLKIDPEVPRWILGDPTRLQQIIINLLSNAVKFTERGHIALEITPSGPLELVFRVKDTGIGMSPEALAQIFESFTQADATVTRRFGGTGLGLTICRDLVERMGGQIEVESKEGRGTQLWFKLPVERADGRTPPPEAEPPSADRQLSLLVAEDNKVNQRLVGLMLSRMGHQARIVEDGLSAVEVCAEGRFDAILMDVRMPRMDGLVATRTLRRSGCRIPIIGVTANVSAEEVRQCLRAGMDAVLGKPYRLHQLAETLKAHVDGVRPSHPHA